METKEKYCENCGAKLSEDDLFCPACGIKSEIEDEKSNKPKLEDNLIRTTSQNLNKKSKHKKMWGLLLGILFIIVLIFVLMQNDGSKTEKTTSKGTTTQNNIIEGQGEYGATFTFDFEEFKKKLHKSEIGDAFENKTWKKETSSMGTMYRYDYSFKQGDSYALVVYLEDNTNKVQLISLWSTSVKYDPERMWQTQIFLNAIACNIPSEDFNNIAKSNADIYDKSLNYGGNWILIDQIGTKVAVKEGSSGTATAIFTAPWSQKSIKEKIQNGEEEFIFIKGEDLNEKYSPIENQVNKNSITEDNNYTQYIGSWQDNNGDIYQSGGTLLEIKSIKNNAISFSLTKVFSNGNILTFVDNINAQVKNDEVSFNYTDSRDNSGEGTLKFKDSSITAILTTTQKGEDSTYAADTNAILHKSDASLQQNSVNTEPNEYIFPDSNVRYLSESEVMAIDPSLLVYARNEIFARHGRMFDDPEIKSYFESKSWYNGTIPGAEFDSTVVNSLNDYEKANVEVIKNVEILQKDFEGQRNWNGV